MDALEFDADKHEYRVSGVLFPSVTQVLGLLEDWGGIPASVFAAAGEFGTNVHDACHLLNRGALDWDSLDPALEPYVRQYERFLAESGAVPILSEHRVCDRKLKYAGTLDVLAAWGSKSCLVDLKTSAVVPSTVGPQTAAYATALAADGEFNLRELMANRYCLHLQADKYRIHRLKGVTDWHVFQAALTVHQWKARNA